MQSSDGPARPMLSRVDDWVSRLNRWLVAAMLAATFGIVFANVVLRYLFGWSLTWAEEVARYLMVAGAFFGAGLALREGRLVAIEFLQDLLPLQGRRVVRITIAVMMLLFMAALVWFGSEFVVFGWRRSTVATDIPRGIPYLAIPIGAALFVIHLLFFLRGYVERDFAHDDGPVEAEGV
ncbi:TRAP transporter small permease [Acuticoccus sp. M5D2P5]|uniref:TRAP transporter small permease n=1 Tax=Acuticoccus kalidii TaxID=2910977 RepID=UPI001F449B17|nr:TRAP transporter small permease [Acuticoccus kalidii]MCF3934685.1 TRAP transporter small permease [Acuticoccus kalidii]